MAESGHIASNPHAGAETKPTDIEAQLPLLITALRARVETVEALAELTGTTTHEAATQVASLAALGLVSFDGQRISYHSPDQALGVLASRTLDDAQAGINAAVAQARSLIASIPETMHAWADGAVQGPDLRVQAFHGPNAATELLVEIATTHGLRRSGGVLPDARRFVGAPPELKQRWREVAQGQEGGVRALITVADAALPGALDMMLDGQRAAGAEYRMLPELPMWFWVADDVVAVPFTWGDPWPASAMAVRSAPVVRLMNWVFELLWEQAIPVGPRDAPPHDQLLELLAEGATFSRACSALGISERTGRRRLSAASEHYGVDGLFALGAAWAREQA